MMEDNPYQKFVLDNGLILLVHEDHKAAIGAISQAKLDEQRGVVQNEKRQGDNRPYAPAEEI